MNLSDQTHAAHAELASHRDYLLRFAKRKLQNDDLAQDLVQDTLMAAMQSMSYKGQSTLRVWLVGILKHKMIDHHREARRYLSLDTPRGNEEDGEDWTSQLEAETHTGGTDPVQTSALHELLARADQVIRELPPGIAEVFMRKEIDGESTESLCKSLGITADNVWVRVHRARKALQQKLKGKESGFVPALA
jgi:RNA polymerase sigma-70 factor, ECF subfamily